MGVKSLLKGVGLVEDTNLWHPSQKVRLRTLYECTVSVLTAECTRLAEHEPSSDKWRTQGWVHAQGWGCLNEQKASLASMARTQHGVGKY